MGALDIKTSNDHKGMRESISSESHHWKLGPSTMDRSYKTAERLPVFFPDAMIFIHLRSTAVAASCSTRGVRAEDRVFLSRSKKEPLAKPLITRNGNALE